MPSKESVLRKSQRRRERQAEEALAAGGEQAKKVVRTEDGRLALPDKIWLEVPPLEDLSEADREKASRLCRALYEGVQDLKRKSKTVTVSLLGSHFKVHSLKKDPIFANQRLSDLIKRHSEVFEVEPTPEGGSSAQAVVSLKPNAGDNLPEATAIEEVEMEVALEGMPQRIEKPTGKEESLQAFRVEVVLALAARGSSAHLNELGQEPRITKLKSKLHSTMKLLDMIKGFRENFKIEDVGNGQYKIDLISSDVTDKTVIIEQLPRFQGRAKSQGNRAKSEKEDREMVVKIKEYQRQSITHRAKWYKYCEEFGSTESEGSFDPARHDDALLQAFLEADAEGTLEEPDEDTLAEIEQRDQEVKARKAKGKVKGSMGMDMEVFMPSWMSKGMMKGKGGKDMMMQMQAMAYMASYWGEWGGKKGKMDMMMKGKGKGKGKSKCKGTIYGL